MNQKTEYVQLPLSSIVCADRFRQQYNNIEQLAMSIKAHGLAAPLGVWHDGSGTYHLIYGGRRYEACKIAMVDIAPVLIYPPETTEDERLMLELIENTDREPLTWQEEVNLRAEIHRRMKAIYSNPMHEHSLADTAKFLGVDTATISRDVMTADALTKLPTLAKCESKADALRVIKKLSIHSDNEKAAQKFTETVAASSHFNKDMVMADWYKIGDFLTVDLPDNHFRMCEVDPPYGIDLQDIKTHTEGSKLINDMLYNEVAESDYLSFLYAVYTRCYKAMTDNSWLLAWHASRYAGITREILETVGFKVNAVPLIWYKSIMGQTNNPKYCLASVYEPCYYAHKGTAELSIQGESNVFTIPPVTIAQKIHPTERPIILMNRLISIFSNPGSNILVPFAGSGVTLCAAYQMKRTALGFDLTEEYRNAFVARLLQQQ